MKNRGLARMAGCVLLFGVAAASGDTTAWNGATGNWSTAGNWTNGLPAAGMDVLITNGSVLLDAETPALNLFQMNGGTLIFSNWTTRLNATNIAINGGIVTLPAAFSNGFTSNRIWMACTQDFTLAAGAVIDVLGKGFFQGQGAGKGTGTGGGGHGGSGGVVGGDGGVAHGSVSVPVTPGSGGGIGSAYKGGSGGGAVRIEAGGVATVNGTIAANGSNATHYGGGGAGGSVFIQCATFGGLTNGLISASGGDGCWWEGNLAYLGQGGGGGRVAVDYGTLAENHAVRFVASKGPDNAELPAYVHLIPRAAEMGTLWLPNPALLSESMNNRLFKDVRLVIPGFTNWAVDSLTISNCSFAFDQPMALTVTNSLRIAAGALRVQGNVTVQAGDLALDNGGGLYVTAMPTNSASPDYGALLQVGGDVRVATNAWLYPIADRTNGATVLMRMQNLTIATNGGINADGRGFQDTKGPGAVGITTTGGAGHGGLGNVAGNAVGPVYGSTNNPVLPGSGGGLAIYGGFGGGVVRIEATNTVTVHGTITANGMGNLTTGSGCGSGGSINLACQVFGGNGLISAGGGSGQSEYPTLWYGGAGGGGRIAVRYTSFSTPRAIRFRTSGGLGTERKNPHRIPLAAKDGTLWLPDTQLLSETLTSNLFTGVRLVVPGFTNWGLNQLTVSNCSVTLPDTGFTLTVTNDVLVGANGKLAIVGNLSVLQGNLRLTNGGVLTVYAQSTNGTPGDAGAKVSVAGDMSIGIGSWALPIADDALGGCVKFTMQNLAVATNAGFDADVRGYSRGRGPGSRGTTGSAGGGYGGRGGYYFTIIGGPENGLTNAPLGPGSAGGYVIPNWEQSGFGGGSVWIEAVNEVLLNGTITANGGAAGGTGAGAGAGGGILVSCTTFKGGATGVLRADGKNGPWHTPSSAWYGGGGGGGRIAVWQKVTPAMRQALITSQATPSGVSVSPVPFSTYLGAYSVTNGMGWGSNSVVSNAQSGTIVFLLQRPPTGTVIVVR